MKNNIFEKHDVQKSTKAMNMHEISSLSFFYFFFLKFGLEIPNLRNSLKDLKALHTRPNTW
jgi:hypothetical protein